MSGITTYFWSVSMNFLPILHPIGTPVMHDYHDLVISGNPFPWLNGILPGHLRIGDSRVDLILNVQIKLKQLVSKVERENLAVLSWKYISVNTNNLFRNVQKSQAQSCKRNVECPECNQPWRPPLAGHRALPHEQMILSHLYNTAPAIGGSVKFRPNGHHQHGGETGRFQCGFCGEYSPIYFHIRRL